MGFFGWGMSIPVLSHVPELPERTIDAIKVYANPFTDESQDAHRQVYGEERHEAKFSHEAIAGAASFEAFKAFEDHQRKEGGYSMDQRSSGTILTGIQGNLSRTSSPRSSSPASWGVKSTVWPRPRAWTSTTGSRPSVTPRRTPRDCTTTTTAAPTSTTPTSMSVPLVSTTTRCESSATPSFPFVLHRGCVPE